MLVSDLPPRHPLRTSLSRAALGTDGVFLAARPAWWRYVPPLWGFNAAVLTIDGRTVAAHRCAPSHQGLEAMIASADIGALTVTHHLGGRRTVVAFPSGESVTIDGRAATRGLVSALAAASATQ